MKTIISISLQLLVIVALFSNIATSTAVVHGNNRAREQAKDETELEAAAPAHLSSKFSQRPTYIKEGVLKLLPHKIAASLVTQTSDEVSFPDRENEQDKPLRHTFSPERMRFREQREETEEQNENVTPISSHPKNHHLFGPRHNHHEHEENEDEREEHQDERQDEQEEEQEQQQQQQQAPQQMRMMESFQQAPQPFNPYAPNNPMQQQAFFGNLPQAPSAWQMNPAVVPNAAPRAGRHRPRFASSRGVELPHSIVEARLSRMRRRKEMNGRGNTPMPRFRETAQNTMQQAPMMGMPMGQMGQAPMMPQQQMPQAPMMMGMPMGQMQPPMMPPSFSPPNDDVDLPGADSVQFQNMPPQFGLLEESQKVHPHQQRSQPQHQIPQESDLQMTNPELIEMGENEAANLAAGLNVAVNANAAAENTEDMPNLAPTERTVTRGRDPSIPEPPSFESAPPLENESSQSNINGIRADSYDPVQLNHEVFG